MAERDLLELFVLRHAPTDWNIEGKIQGRSDVCLSVQGRAQAKAWRLPAGFECWESYSSPLKRARETAALIGLSDCKTEQRIIEMDWGTWEGRSLRELRAELGETMTRMERLGLDFQPPGGESPRNVQMRLLPFLGDLFEAGRPAVLVTHKGVLRALYAMASNWDMKAKPSEKLRDAHAHLFGLRAAESRPELQVLRLNIPLEGSETDDA